MIPGVLTFYRLRSKVVIELLRTLLGVALLWAIIAFSTRDQTVYPDAEKLFFEGYIKEKVPEGEVPIPQAAMIVFQGDQVLDSIRANENGRVKADLNLYKGYRVQCEAPGYHTKVIAVNTTVPPDSAKYGFDFAGWTMHLIPKANAEDFTNKTLVARIFYDPELGFFNYEKLTP